MSREPRRDPARPRHPDDEAELVERGEGAHAEHVTEEANLRADPGPPPAPPDSDEEDEDGA